MFWVAMLDLNGTFHHIVLSRLGLGGLLWCFVSSEIKEIDDYDDAQEGKP